MPYSTYNGQLATYQGKLGTYFFTFGYASGGIITYGTGV